MDMDINGPNHPDTCWRWGQHDVIHSSHCVGALFHNLQIVMHVHAAKYASSINGIGSRG